MTVGAMQLASMVPRPNLAADAAASLARAIRDGSLAPGLRLPSEADIARQLGVSRPVVREAIAFLKADGIVESRRGLGLFVSKPDTLRLRLAEIEESEQTILEFLEFRLGLEAEAAQLAALRHGPEDLGRMQAALGALEAADAAGEPSAERDLAFHLAIADAAHSPLYSKVLRFVAGPLLNSIRSMRARDGGAAIHVAARGRDHRRICARIQARDAGGAGAAMREHIGESYRRYAASMDPSRDGAKPHPALDLPREIPAP